MIKPNLSTFYFSLSLLLLILKKKTSKVGTLKMHNQNLLVSSSANQSATTTITTVSSNNHSNNNIITTSTPKLELPQTTTIQIQSSNQSIANSNQQQVCLESMQLNDVDVRTNQKALFLIDVYFYHFRCAYF